LDGKGYVAGADVARPVVGGPWIELIECGRFPNGPVADDGGLRWDLEQLWRGIVAGLREAAAVASARALAVRGIGVDSWAVDHGFLDDDGALVARPWCYRDSRTEAARARVYARIPFAEHYAVNGLQDLPFTSLFQLVASAAGPGRTGADAAKETAAVEGAAADRAVADEAVAAEVAAGRATEWSRAAQVLLVPDLITYRLTGRRVAEVTNASTPGLLDARTRVWSEAHIARLAKEFPELGDLRARLPELVEPGTAVGHLLPEIREATGLAEVPVFAVGSHDTASAVAAAPLPPAGRVTPAGSGEFVAPTEPGPAQSRPAQSGHAESGPLESIASAGTPAGAPVEVAAYISSGTWSLVGLELGEPVLSDASRDANFTNELGVDGTVRYLRNVMGLWILNECVREWSEADGGPVDLRALLGDAAREPGGRCLIEVDGEGFLAPGDMPARVRAAIERRLSDDDGRATSAVPPEATRPDGAAPVPAGPGGGSTRSSEVRAVPDSRPAMVRVILDSLAAAYARVVRRAGELAGVRVTSVHVVGGGSQNDLLNRLTADATGLPVHAGPVEATALGNVLVQARAAGALTGPDGTRATLSDLRATSRASTPLRTYDPSMPSPVGL
jgi:rhamnulokinase